MSHRKACFTVAIALGVFSAAAIADTKDSENADRTRADGLWREGLGAQHAGSYAESERLLREALAIRMRTPGPDHYSTAQVQNDLAAALYYQSKFTEAESLYKRALATFTVESGHLADRAVTLGNLGSLYREQRRIADAEAVYEQGFEMFRMPGVVNDMVKAVILSDYGMLEKLKGNAAAARKAFDECLAIRERTLPPGHPQLLMTWNALADFEYGGGQFARAEELFRKTVSTCDASPNLKDDRVCAGAYNGLALTLGARGMDDEAQRYFERALAIFERNFGADHPRVAAVLNNMGTLADGRGDLKRAEKYMQRALDMWVRLFGPEHPDVASARSNLASVYLKRKQFGKAESLYQSALAVDEKVFGPAHEKVAVDLNNLAALYNNAKRFDEAEQCFDRAAAIYEKMPNQAEMLYAALLANRAAMRVNRGLLEEAVPLYRRALDIYEKYPANLTPRIAMAFENYAGLMRKLKEPAEAEKAAMSAMRIRVQNTLASERFHSSFAAN